MGSGVAKRPILGPELRNILYDGLLRLEWSEDVISVGYANWIA